MAEYAPAKTGEHPRIYPGDVPQFSNFLICVHVFSFSPQMEAIVYIPTHIHGIIVNSTFAG